MADIKITDDGHVLMDGVSVDEYRANMLPTSNQDLVDMGMLQEAEAPQDFKYEGGKDKEANADASVWQNFENSLDYETRHSGLEYEKLGLIDSWKDAGKALGNEFSHLWQRKKTYDGALSVLNILPEEKHYDERTHFAENVKYLWRYGSWFIPFTGWSKLLKASKLVKQGGLLARGTQLLSGEFGWFNKGGKIRKYIGQGIAGLPAGAIADITNYREYDEGTAQLADVFGDTDNPFIQFLQSDYDDTAAEAAFKRVMNGAAAGFGLGSLGSAAVDGIVRASKAVKNVFKKGAKASKQEIEEAAAAVEQSNKIGNQAELAAKIESAFDKAKEQGIADEAVEDFIRQQEWYNAGVQSDVKELLEHLKANQKIELTDTGAFAVKVEKYQDAAEVSLDELRRQTNNDGTALMNEAAEDVWKERGWLGADEQLLNKNMQTGKITVNTKAVNRIKDNYIDKFKIDNKIDIQFTDGKINGADGSTQYLEYKGKIQKDKKPLIDKKKIEIQKIQDKITMLEGGNREVSDPLDVLKKQLQTAERELKNLQEPVKTGNIKILINKNTDKPYAVLRAELEHARDIAKGEVPKDIKQKHFARYNGRNESEMSLEYVKKKADKRAASFTNYTKGEGINAVQVMDIKHKGVLSGRIQYREIIKGKLYIEWMQNAGVKAGAVREGIAQILKENPDKIVQWQAVNEKSLNSYNKFIKEYPNLADRIEFHNTMNDSDFHTFDNFLKDDYNSEKGIINEKGINNSQDLSGSTEDIYRNTTESLSADAGGKNAAGGGDAPINNGEQHLKSGGFSAASREGEYTAGNNNKQIEGGSSGASKSDIQPKAELIPVSTQLAQAQNTADVHSAILHKLRETHAGSHTWEKSALDDDKLYDFFKQNGWDDVTSIRQAFARGDVEFVDQIVHLQQTAAKLSRDLCEQLVNETNPEKIHEITDGLQHIHDWVKDLSSSTARSLNEIKFTRKCFSYFGLTPSNAEGVQSFVNALYSTLQSLNFTTNNKEVNSAIFRALNKNFPDLMGSLLQRPEVFDLFDNALKDAVKKAGNPKSLSKRQLEKLITGLMEDAQLRAAREYLLMTAPEALPQAVKTMNREQIWQGLGTYQVSNMLGSLTVQTKNVSEGLFLSVAAPFEKWTGGVIDTVIGALKNDENMLLRAAQKKKEAFYTYTGHWLAFNEAWKAGMRAFKAGKGNLSHIGKEAVFGNDTEHFIQLANVSDLEFKVREGETAGEALRRNLGMIHTMPLRFMGAADEFITHLNYRAISAAQALSKSDNILLEGLEGAEKAKAVREQLETFGASAFDSSGRPLNSQAYYEAREIVLQAPQSGKVWNYSTKQYDEIRPQTMVMTAAQAMQERMHPAARLFFRFIGTPANAMQQTLDHNIFAAVISPAQRELLFSSTEQGTLARGRVVTGALAFAGMFGACSIFSDRITGNYPADKEAKQALIKAGFQPYSIKIGNKWYSYKNVEPLHSILGFAADSHALLTSYMTDKDKIEPLSQYMLGGAKILYDNFIDKASFMQSMEQMTALTEFLENPADKAASSALANFLSSFLPASGFVKETFKELNPDKRTPETFYEKLFNKYFNSGLGDFKRNIWGERQDVYQLAFIKSTDASEQIEDIELQRLAEKGFSPAELLDGESNFTFKWSQFKSEGHSQSLYSLMLRRMGDIEINGMTLREAVRECIQSDEYQMLQLDGTHKEAEAVNMKAFSRKDNTKINMLKDIFDVYRKRAVSEIIDEYGDEYVNKEGITASRIKELQELNHRENLLNQELGANIENIRSFK